MKLCLCLLDYTLSVSGLFSKDTQSDYELSLIVDRAQGGGSITDDTMELMVHRRLLVDDKYGVREPLNETSYGQGESKKQGAHMNMYYVFL